MDNKSEWYQEEWQQITGISFHLFVYGFCLFHVLTTVASGIKELALRTSALFLPVALGFFQYSPFQLHDQHHMCRFIGIKERMNKNVFQVKYKQKSTNQAWRKKCRINKNVSRSWLNSSYISFTWAPPVASSCARAGSLLSKSVSSSPLPVPSGLRSLPLTAILHQTQRPKTSW